ncbi:MAG: hypothetical protein ACLRFN_03600 [Alphaproteobacteria bacterium]
MENHNNNDSVRFQCFTPVVWRTAPRPPWSGINQDYDTNTENLSDYDTINIFAPVVMGFPQPRTKFPFGSVFSIS